MPATEKPVIDPETWWQYVVVGRADGTRDPREKATWWSQQDPIVLVVDEGRYPVRGSSPGEIVAYSIVALRGRAILALNKRLWQLRNGEPFEHFKGRSLARDSLDPSQRAIREVVETTLSGALSVVRFLVRHDQAAQLGRNKPIHLQDGARVGARELSFLLDTIAIFAESLNLGVESRQRYFDIIADRSEALGMLMNPLI